jgi:hypothetical protein
MNQNKAVNELYGPLTGTYKGTLHNYKIGDEDVRLVIYISNVAVTNPDGTPGSKDVPLATLYRDDPVIGDYAMDVKGFQAETGNLSFGTLGNDTAVRTISAHIAGGKITGTVNDSASTIGTLELNFISKDTGSRDDIEERLRRRFQALQGIYTGEIPNQDPKLVHHLSVSLTAVVNGSSVKLNGYYKNLDVPSGVVDLPLTVDYRWDVTPPAITMVGRGNLKYELDFTGTVENDIMVVDVNSPFMQGFLGTATLKKTSGLGDDPAQTELLKQYQMVAGNYAGNLMVGKKATPVVVALTAAMVNHKATMSAHYTPASDANSEMDLMVSYTPKSGSISMSGQTVDGHSRTLSGKIGNNMLTVNLMNQKKVLGTAKLQKQ